MTGTVVERFADSRGVRIRYLDNQPERPAGAPVLFSMGIVDAADDYLPVFEVFGDRRLLVVEGRGRGGSEAPASGYSAPDQAGDLEAVLDDNGVEPFHLMTFSRGTSAGLQVALRRPDRVLSVSVGDYLAAEVRLPEELVEQMWATSWRGKPYPDRIARHALEGIQAESVAREYWDDLAGLGVPVLLARGQAGALIDDEREARFRQAIPGVEVVTIVGSGHDLFRPSRTAYPEAVVDFIARRCPGA